jgi:hypothetical protein
MNTSDGTEQLKPLDKPAEEAINSWSIAGLKLSIELSKDLLVMQSQRRLSLESRSSLLIPISATILVALATSLISGRFSPTGEALFFAWATGIVLLLGIILSLANLARPHGNFAGMEPKDVLHRYASEAGERGLLKVVSDEYQRRIEDNNSQLRFMTIWTASAIGCVVVGLSYGAIMITKNYSPSLPPITSTSP